MLNIKRFACTGLAAILVVSLPACGKDKSSGYTPLPEEDDTVYNTATITTISHRALTMP